MRFQSVITNCWKLGRLSSRPGLVKVSTFSSDIHLLTRKQDLDISHSNLSDHRLQDLLIEFRLFASRVENMRFLRTTLQLVIDLPARKDEVSTKNIFTVGDYLPETNGSPELPVFFQERMYRCLHDDLETIYAGEVEVDLTWEDTFDKAIAKEEGDV